MILENIYVFKILKQISLKLGMPVGCFFSHHSVTVAGIRSPAMRKQTHDDLISNFGETPSDPRCELIEQWFVVPQILPSPLIHRPKKKNSITCPVIMVNSMKKCSIL